MDDIERDNRVTAWWLGIAPSRQEELLMREPPPMPWLEASLAEAAVDADDIRMFLEAKRSELEVTRDAGLNPPPG